MPVSGEACGENRRFGVARRSPRRRMLVVIRLLELGRFAEARLQPVSEEVVHDHHCFVDRGRRVGRAAVHRVRADRAERVLGQLQRPDPRRVLAGPADVHRLVPATRTALVPGAPRRHRVLRPRHGDPRACPGDHRTAAVHDRRVLPLRPSRRNCSSTHPPFTYVARGWTTNRTPSRWTATRSARCWSRPD